MQEAKTLNIYFDVAQSFEMNNVKTLGGIVGLYFIFTKTTYIQYPFKASRLLYIGMSEKMTNSISSRLTGHFDGKSKNIGLFNYRQISPLYFCYFNYEVFKSTWKLRIEDLESYFILDFVKHFGVYPICNNRTGSEILMNDVAVQLNIDWNYFN